MKRFSLIASLVAMLAIPATGQIVQQAGADFLLVEAEDFTIDELNDEFTGFLTIDVNDPQEVDLHGSNPGTIFIPPADTNASGQAIFDQVGGGDHKDQVGWELQFAEAGTYYLYTRHTFFDMRDILGNNYGNEDSIYIPVEDITENPGYNGPLGDVENEDIIATRDSAFFVSSEIDGVAYVPSDGCRFDDEPWFLEGQECDDEGFRGEEQWEGQYHWQLATWHNGLGEANYAIAEGDVGTVLDFKISTRERGFALDAMIFSTDPALSGDELDALLESGGGPGEPTLEELNSITNLDDRIAYVHDRFGTWMGDANLDGEFNSGDLVQVFGAGEYEDDEAGNSLWEEGDWNGDGDFTSGDLVTAFSDGGYENGPRGATSAAVPEPMGITTLLLAGLGLFGTRRRS